jgi:hypothetical protein
VAMIEAAYRHHRIDALPQLRGAPRRPPGRGDTDGQGFLAALRTVVDPAGRSLPPSGADGAARAIAVEAAR